MSVGNVSAILEDRETAARYKHDYTTSSLSHETKENWKGTPKQARFIG